MNQKIKDYLGIAAIIAVLLVAFAAISYARTYARTVEPTEFRTFAVTGEGKIDAVPDVAIFSFSIVSEGGKDLGALQEDNTNKANKAIEYVKSQGVAAKDIKTSGYNVEPRYQYSNCYGRSVPSGAPDTCPPPAIVGYTVRQEVTVKARDFSKVGAMLSGVVQNGANTVSQLTFTQDDPTAAQTEAREEAIAKAKTKAKEMAKAGGFKVGRLISIDEGGDGYPIPYYYGKDTMARGAAEDSAQSAPATPAPIEPGSQETTVYVTLRYEIK